MEEPDIPPLDTEIDEMDAEDIDEDAVTGQTPHRPTMSGSVSPTPLRTPKTPFQTPRNQKTPRTVLKSATQPPTEKKKKKKSKRKSQLDLPALTNKQVALAALQSSQILHLKLCKRYYAEALNFVRQIEGTMETIGQLLGSKNKPEVLEVIEFFRVAHEYQFSGAEVSR